ncbi:hypothetical protein HMPREF1548_03908 [Clostridium sp. KLE 1755]|nr:hypothetical protein HMPREF1548_03908 [Clostridium sp. KLE 1755]
MTCRRHQTHNYSCEAGHLKSPPKKAAPSTTFIQHKIAPKK